MDGKEHFNPILYAGTRLARSISGVGFQPDLTWIKSRTNAEAQAWFDAVRGATKVLKSEGTAAEVTVAQSLTSFDSDGFSLGTDDMVNGGPSPENYVAWNWKAGGTGVANTTGTIDSTVSANPTAGFSIVKFTGTATTDQTVGHGLSQAPELIIFKRTGGTAGWSRWIFCYLYGLDFRLLSRIK